MASRTKYVDFFFDEPTTAQSKHIIGEACSTLYLLRRELEQCLMGKGLLSDEYVPERKGIMDADRCIQFSSAMVLFAGIDLLAKLYAGSDERNKAEERFVEFLVNMCDMSQGDAERYYFRQDDVIAPSMKKKE